MNESLHEFEDAIRRDVSAFADVGTEVAVTSSGRHIQVTWETQGETRIHEFVREPDGDILHKTPYGTQPYPAFLAGDNMADLRRIARAIQRQRPLDPHYVDSQASWGSERGPAVATLLEAVREGLQRAAATRIVFLTAEAGVGKTSALRKLVHDQALAYERNQSPFLFLYIDAQGRALARFNEALATELDDLRAPISYHTVSALVRRGLVVPVVDGFDELIGSKGSYDDAFNSLRDFVDTLHGHGVLVASARSIYYEQEFVRRAGQALEDYWEQEAIEVLPWRREEFDRYVDKRLRSDRISSDDLDRARQQLETIFSGNNARLRAKPLFVSRTVELVLQGRGQELLQTEDLLQDLVKLFVEREAKEKLQYARGGSVLSAEQLISLFSLLAEEMWNLETRELNTRTLQEIAEFFVEGYGLPEDAHAVVIERAPDLAFLMPGFKPGTVSFEHEMFFGWFLAISLSKAVVNGGDGLRLLLGRSLLPEEAARSTAARLLPSDSLREDLERALSHVSVAATPSTPGNDQIRDNGGMIVGSLLKRSMNTASFDAEGVTIQNLTFPGGDLHDVAVANLKLESVLFKGTDLRRTKFLTCTAKHCRFESPLVDPGKTRLELEGLEPRRDIVGLQVSTNGDIDLLFDPEKISAVLEAIGAARVKEAPPISPELEPLVHLLSRLMKHYRRANPICLQDSQMASIVADRNWRRIEQALLNSEVATEETKSASGGRKRWLRRRFLPEQVMSGIDPDSDVPPPIRRFWDQLREDTQR